MLPLRHGLGRLSALMAAMALSVPQVWATSAVSGAHFVWSTESVAGSKIKFSSYNGADWSSPETVFADDKLNILPAIAYSNTGDAVIVWCAVSTKGVKLKYLERRNSKWSEPEILTEFRTVNLAPVLLYDKSAGFSVFWSSNDGDDDDIYHARLIAGQWSEPALVHEKNADPDGLPEAGFDESGNIWVSWQTLESGALTEPVAIFRTSTSSTAELAPAIDVSAIREKATAEFELPPPPWFQSKSRATMYIPADNLYPARLFKGNLLP